MTDWLDIRRGAAPLIVSLPHTGDEMPAEIADRFLSPWLAVRDADWHVEKLYAFAADLDATLIRTRISRSAIDVNRDPSGASLYPGQATTELCPTTTFDGEALYGEGAEPDADSIAQRRERWFDPYHAALAGEIARLRAAHPRIVLYDAHSIRSRIPRLFAGELPHFNIGTNSGASCAPALQDRIAGICASSSFSHVANGRFKGGYITRRYGDPAGGVHAVQMELAIRTYMTEPPAPSPANWPPPWDPEAAEPCRRILHAILETCLTP